MKVRHTYDFRMLSGFGLFFDYFSKGKICTFTCLKLCFLDIFLGDHKQGVIISSDGRADYSD